MAPGRDAGGADEAWGVWWSRAHFAQCLKAFSIVPAAAPHTVVCSPSPHLDKTAIHGYARRKRRGRLGQLGFAFGLRCLATPRLRPRDPERKLGRHSSHASARMHTLRVLVSLSHHFSFAGRGGRAVVGCASDEVSRPRRNCGRAEMHRKKHRDYYVDDITARLSRDCSISPII